jgi:hypothetical protein
MKKFIYAFGACLGLISTSAHATVINFSGAHVNMGNVDYGQTGAITNLYQTLFTLPPHIIGGGDAYGFLPANAKITFSYTFTGLEDGQLQSYSSYNYKQGGNQYFGSATADTKSFGTAVGTVNGLPSAPLVFASADLNVVNPGTSTGTTTIFNTTSAMVQFESLFFGLLNASPRGVGSATYAVSSIPLPAALPMFLALIGGFAVFSRVRKNRSAVSAMAA